MPSPINYVINVVSGSHIRLGVGTPAAVPIRTLTLFSPSVSSVSTEFTISIINTGNTNEYWQLVTVPHVSFSVSSGTLNAGMTQDITVIIDSAGSYTLSVTAPDVSVTGNNRIVVASIYAPPPIGNFVPRNATSMLFQPIDTKEKVITVAPPHPYARTAVLNLEGYGRIGTGPTAYYIDMQAGWEWKNLGGDWLDKDLTPQGSVPWASSITTAANNTEYSVNVTDMYNHIRTTGHWAAFFLHYTVGIRTLASRRNTNPAYIPRVEVVYEDATTETLDITCMASISTGSTIPNTWTPTMNLPVVMESRKPNPNKVITSATLKFTVTGHFGSPGAIIARLVNPDTTTTVGPAGIAPAMGAFDAGITAEPGVILAQRYVDGTLRSDFISNDTSSLYDSDFDPNLYGIVGPPNPTKFPQRAALKWVNAGDLSLVDSSYSADGFVPLAPGLGAIKVTIPATSPMEEGYVGSAGGSLGTTSKLFLPLEYMSTLQHGRMRYYVRFAFERPLTLTERRLFFSSGSEKWVDYSGKFGPSFNHNTPNGGVSASAGSGLGWQGRLQWVAQTPNTEGPNLGGICLGVHIKSDFGANQPTGYNYTNLGQYFNEQAGQKGGYGGVIQEQQWHLIEIDFKLNTVTNSGTGFIPDGHWRLYIDNRLAVEHTGMVMRTLPINNRIGAPTVTLGAGNVGNGVFVDQAGYTNGIWANDARAIPETIVITFTSATTYSPVGSFYGTYPDGTVGVPYVSARYHKWQINAGSTPYQAGDTITVLYSIYGGPGPRTGTFLTQQRDLGIRDLWFNWFHGGLTETPIAIHGYITGLVVADGSVVPHIGPMNLPVPVPAWITARTLNTWGEIPTANTLASLNPDNDPLVNPVYPSAPPWRSTGNWNTITSAWNGMAWDESTATGWWVDAGGHNDQHANGVIKLDLNKDVPDYVRVRKPSGAVGMATIGAGEWNQTPQVAEFSDGRPRARHTVNMTFYWPGVGPGNITEILLSPSGGFEFGRLRPYIISESTGERVYLGANKNNEPSGGWCASCYDPVRNVVWKMPTSANVPFSKWGGPSNDVWTDVGTAHYFAGSVSMTYIPGHDVILVGNGGNDAGNNQTIVGGWAVFDPSTGTLHTPTFTGAPLTAPNGDASGLWPGIVQPRWAASLNAVLAWDMDSGHTTKILRLTPPADPRTGTWVIDYLPLSGANTVTPAAAPAAGTYGKFFVWDDMRICGVITSATHGGYFFKYG